jgi:hypothetical protein
MFASFWSKLYLSPDLGHEGSFGNELRERFHKPIYNKKGGSRKIPQFAV